ncbi:hypothetical protein M2132_000556 [Dysgonomonas sp. PH5-45]|uniref:hypothetical protein n=1 Tax=unclassified Dysgonomonas TaxID=2630389 RepID=UPI0024731D6F|nr:MULTISPECIES: hypothetical protein [unclassified Dysgonomonas]MDH6354229.1 hypothetical protein [Dysgonomonas sp. PH5-45]MDH6387130.1 hypothetical protein [Dysgonomonas sp. PH5-37]
MDLKEKVRELRQMVPVPVSEAMALLKENEGDTEKCVYLFKAKSVKEICVATGCDEATATRHYEAEKFDINKAISAIREEAFDRNYKEIEGVTFGRLNTVSEWIRLIEEKDFATSLDYIRLRDVTDTLSLIPSTAEIAEKVLQSQKIKAAVFEGYSDNDAIDEFVRRHQRLDDSPEFQACLRSVVLKLTVLKEEIGRYKRNLVRIYNNNNQLKTDNHAKR